PLPAVGAAPPQGNGMSTAAGLGSAGAAGAVPPNAFVAAPAPVEEPPPSRVAAAPPPSPPPLGAEAEGPHPQRAPPHPTPPTPPLPPPAPIYGAGMAMPSPPYVEPRSRGGRGGAGRMAALVALPILIGATVVLVLVATGTWSPTFGGGDPGIQPTKTTTPVDTV